MNQDNAYLKQTLNLAYDAIRKKNYINGKTLLEKAISINSNIPEVYNDLGLLNLNTGEIDKAILNFEKALEIRSAVKPLLVSTTIAWALIFFASFTHVAARVCQSLACFRLLSKCNVSDLSAFREISLRY